MQRVIRNQPNQLEIFNQLDELYSYVSDEDTGSLVPPVFDSRLQPLFQLFNSAMGNVWEASFSERPIQNMPVIKGDKLILCYSGGKDSIASAIKYKECGIEPLLYHVQHVNRSQSDETKLALQSARALGLTVVVDDLRYSGTNMYMEHPMKNMMIACCAINFALRMGIPPNIAFGNYSTSFLADEQFEVCAGDCVDMWEYFEDIVRTEIPDFKIHINLLNMGETLDIVTKHKEVNNLSVSCLCRHSLRDYRRAWVKEKFGVVLPEHRCGSCYKCAIEYVYMADHNSIKFSEAYYKYCLNQLYKAMRMVNGRFVFTIEALWDSCFMYPITQSKIYDLFDSIRLFGANIVWE